MMSHECRYNPCKGKCDLEIEYDILNETFSEFNRAFNFLREEYHELEDYTERFKILLIENGVTIPER